MISLNRILAPTDFSDLGCMVLSYGRDLAERYRAELHVLHVIVPAERVSMMSSATGGESTAGLFLLESAVDLAARTLPKLKAYVAAGTRGLPVPPVAEVRIGVPWQEIAEYAQEARIDLMVIGTHARSPLKRIILGSTSRAVQEHTTCPMLMVRAEGTSKANGKYERRCAAAIPA